MNNKIKKSKEKKIFALSQVFSLILEVFAFAFILGGMGVLSLGEVGALESGTKIYDGAANYIYKEVPGVTSGWYLQEGGSETLVEDRVIWTRLFRYANDPSLLPVGGTLTPPRVAPAAEAPAVTPAPAKASGWGALWSSFSSLFKPSGTPPPAKSSTIILGSLKRSTFWSTATADIDPSFGGGKLMLNSDGQAIGILTSGGAYKEFTSPVPIDSLQGKTSEQILTGNAKTYDGTLLPKGGTKNTFWGTVLTSVTLAATILTISQLVAGFVSNDNTKSMIQAAGLGISAGIMASSITEGLLKGTSWGRGISRGPGSTVSNIAPVIVGVIVGYLVAASQYEKKDKKEVTIEFQCLPWQAPHGGADCNQCNGNSLMPCSEYRCKSLGQTCKLLNAGTGSERCIDSSPNDVTSPGIKPWTSVLTTGYSYTDVKERPPGKTSAKTSGMRITYSGIEDGCLPAFTPFEFGIVTTDIIDGAKTTQPSQCKIDYNHTEGFEDMAYFMGENNLYIENHSQVMSLPGTDLLNKIFESNGSLAVKNDGEYTLYIRCSDGNGNENEDEFAVRFCIDKGEDITAPVIKAVSIPSGSAVLYQSDNVSLEVYTNEPSNCRWSRAEASYTNMENQMDCSNEIWEMNAEMLYTCRTTLTSIKDKQENNFYFRCEDLTGNSMSDSYKYSLWGTQPLNILKVGPNGTISGSTSVVVTTLSVSTDNGFKNGESTCYYSKSEDEGYIEMFETGGSKHSQNLDLAEGEYTYHYKCVDAGGNTAYNKTSFKIFVDRYAPAITRTYAAEGKLIIQTDENSICKYSTTSCNFDLAKEGLQMPYDDNKIHYADWKMSQTYYIKCKDKDGNQPNPSECSVIARPYQITNA